MAKLQHHISVIGGSASVVTHELSTHVFVILPEVPNVIHQRARETTMPILLWLLGVPIPIIILLILFWH